MLEMNDILGITYDIQQVRCDLPHDDVETFVEHILRGTASISFGDQSIHLPPCGLLRMSRSLIRLCTFPVLYGIEAHESVMDYGIDFRSTYQNQELCLEIKGFGDGREEIVLSLPMSEAIGIVGTFHRNILLEIFRRCPTIIDENRLLLTIPDGFALSFLARTGEISLDETE
jgi:hypothetical protein